MWKGIDGRPASWLTLVIGLLSGAVLMIGAWVGGHPVAGLVAFGIMVVFSAGVLVASGRSETVRGLLDRRDERFVAIDLRATAVSGLATIVAIIVAAVVELARGRSGAPTRGWAPWLG